MTLSLKYLCEECFPARKTGSALSRSAKSWIFDSPPAFGSHNSVPASGVAARDDFGLMSIDVTVSELEPPSSVRPTFSSPTRAPWLRRTTAFTSPPDTSSARSCGADTRRGRAVQPASFSCRAVTANGAAEGLPEGAPAPVDAGLGSESPLRPSTLRAIAVSTAPITGRPAPSHSILVCLFHHGSAVSGGVRCVRGRVRPRSVVRFLNSPPVSDE